MTIPEQHLAPLRRLLEHCRAGVKDYAMARPHAAAEEWQRRADALAAVLEED